MKSMMNLIEAGAVESVPHPRDINDLISGEGLKVALRRQGNFRQLPHLTRSSGERSHVR
jgi:hypothetical protein